MNTLRELFATSGRPELQDSAQLARMEAALSDDGHSKLPWYLQVIQGVGAWLAALFFLAFIGFAVHWGPDSQTVFGVTGLILLAIIIAVGRLVSGVFADQAVLAGSLASQLMIIFGFAPKNFNAPETDMFAYLAIATTILCILLYVVYPRFLHRFVTCWASLFAIHYWLQTLALHYAAPTPAKAVFLLSVTELFYLALVVGVVASFLPLQSGIRFRPIGYACLATYLTPMTFNGFRFFQFEYGGLLRSSSIDHPFFHPWYIYLTPALMAVVLIFVAIWACNSWEKVVAKDPLWMALIMGLVLIVALGTGGTIPALLFMVLGFSLQNRIIFMVGAIYLPYALEIYFETLPLDLLARSGTLVGTGLALLGLRYALRQFQSPKETII